MEEPIKMLHDIFDVPEPQQFEEPTRSRKRKRTKELEVDPTRKCDKIKYINELSRKKTERYY